MRRTVEPEKPSDGPRLGGAIAFLVLGFILALLAGWLVMRLF
jgi:hypothetical protein